MRWTPAHLLQLSPRPAADARASCPPGAWAAPLAPLQSGAPTAPAPPCTAPRAWRAWAPARGTCWGCGQWRGALLQLAPRARRRCRPCAACWRLRRRRPRRRRWLPQGGRRGASLRWWWGGAAGAALGPSATATGAAQRAAAVAGVEGWWWTRRARAAARAYSRREGGAWWAKAARSGARKQEQRETRAAGASRSLCPCANTNEARRALVHCLAATLLSSVSSRAQANTIVGFT